MARKREGADVAVTIHPTLPLTITSLDASTQGGRVVDDKAPWIQLTAPPPGCSMRSIRPCCRSRGATAARRS